MKPLIYGYMRVNQDARDCDVAQMERVLQDYAAREGYCLVTTYEEYDSGTFAAWNDLIEELKRSGARHVVVPALDHISTHRILREQMVERLEVETDAEVHALVDQ